jgi:hypothetical protein
MLVEHTRRLLHEAREMRRLALTSGHPYAQQWADAYQHRIDSLVRLIARLSFEQRQGDLAARGSTNGGTLPENN